jgi:hypothetical protein
MRAGEMGIRGAGEGRFILVDVDTLDNLEAAHVLVRQFELLVLGKVVWARKDALEVGWRQGRNMSLYDFSPDIVVELRMASGVKFKTR